MAATPGEVNFNRLCCLVMNEGTRRVGLAVKDNLYPGQDTLDKALKANRGRFDNLLKKSIIGQQEYDVLYPDSGSIDESLIHLSLWHKLARNITVDCKKVYWSEEPKVNNKMWQYDVIRIKNMRNTLAHLSKRDVNDYVFQDWLAEIKYSLKKLGSTDADINVYLDQDLDPETTRQTIHKLQDQVRLERDQAAIAKAKQKTQIGLLIGLVALLVLLVPSGGVMLGHYLKSAPPCSNNIIRIVSESGVINFIPRSGWGAKMTINETTDPIPRLKTPLKIAAVFHTALVQTDCQVTEDCCKVVRDVQQAHMNGGWQDIAYNFVIANDGVVYEGRGAKTQGAAVWGRNSEVISIALLGNFMCQTPGRTGLVALYVLLEHLLYYSPEDQGHYLDPILAKDYKLYGHCQVNLQTAQHNKSFSDSPGAALMKEIMNWDRWRSDNSSKCILDKDCLKPGQCVKPCSSMSGKERRKPIKAKSKSQGVHYMEHRGGSYDQL